MTLAEYLAAIEARRKRCSDVLDVGGTEQALIGGDIDALLALLTHPHDVDVKQADCPACRWDELAEVTRKYHKAMDVLTAYDKIDHATALAQLAEAQRELARLREWRHVCTMEACCLENAFYALATLPAPRTGKGDTYPDGSPRYQDDSTLPAPVGEEDRK